MRKLIVIRIVHSTSDMGSMKEGLEKEAVSRIGRQRWEENQVRIDRFWQEVETEIDSLGLDPALTRIYQDGLPCAGEIGEKIIRETADKGSRNYGLIRKLMEKGARIEATESPQLLIQEYNYIRALVEAKTDKEKIEAISRYDAVKDELIAARDSFIARSIDSSLKNDETGLLFIGAHHNVLPKLQKDIEVRCLD